MPINDTGYDITIGPDADGRFRVVPSGGAYGGPAIAVSPEAAAAAATPPASTPEPIPPAAPVASAPTAPTEASPTFAVLAPAPTEGN